MKIIHNSAIDAYYTLRNKEKIKFVLKFKSRKIKSKPIDFRFIYLVRRIKTDAAEKKRCTNRNLDN